MSHKKRILIFSLSYYPNFVGGAEVAIKEITDRLGDDFKFDMVTLRFDKTLPKVEKINNVTVYRVGMTSGSHVRPSSLNLIHKANKYLFPLFGFFKAHELQETKVYDVIWSMMASYNSFAALFFKKMFPAVKFLLTLQEGDPISYIKRRALPVWYLFKKIFTKADAIQAISHYLSHFALHMGARCPVVVVPNGVSVDRFNKEYTKAELDAARARLGKGESDIMLITTSRLVIKNGISQLIEALVHLPLNVKLAILGIGPLEKTLKTQARMLEVDDRIVWLGHVSHDEMPKYLKVADIFVRTPISEGFGNSYVEAMACGIPCIATPVGGILDFIRERETGLYADVGSPESVVDAVMELVRNPDLVSKIKRQSFEMVKEKYDWDIVAEGMNSVFKGL